jgi:hypothetical protein
MEPSFARKTGGGSFDAIESTVPKDVEGLEESTLSTDGGLSSETDIGCCNSEFRGSDDERVGICGFDPLEADRSCTEPPRIRGTV